MAYTSPLGHILDYSSFAQLYQASLPHWAHEPEVLTRAEQLVEDAVWSAHQQAKRDLLALIKKEAGVDMLADVPLVGFARRMAEYKRPDLLFADLDRLTTIARERPFQVVFGSWQVLRNRLHLSSRG